MTSRGFPAVADRNARLLILGSLPGRRSIADREYYAHPQNVFWRIVADELGIPRELDYATRTDRLRRHSIALWDVLHSSERPGSLDAAIVTDSACANDFASFFARHPAIELVAFNGRKAAALYRRFAVPARERLPTVELPSTSPAYAAMPYAEKRRRWAAVLRSIA